MKTLIKKLLKEAVEDFKITCENCGWDWMKSESEKSDLYKCHKCGHDNNLQCKK